MASTYYLGRDPEGILGDSPRYWYGLRRTDDGELFLFRSDQLIDKDSITLNESGDPAETFEFFEAGIDYLDGITEAHELEYQNLRWPQYRWDNRSILYYINDEGQLVQRINQSYTYPDGVSSNG